MKVAFTVFNAMPTWKITIGEKTLLVIRVYEMVGGEKRKKNLSFYKHAK